MRLVTIQDGKSQKVFTVTAQDDNAITVDTYGHLMNETNNEAAEHVADLFLVAKW